MKKKCLICDIKLKFLIKYIDRDYSLLYCPICSLIVADPIPTEKFLENYYQSFQYKKESPQLFKTKLANVYKDVLWLIAYFKPTIMKGTLLDYGGGIGIFSHAFSKYGLKVTNIDIDKHSTKFNKNYFKSHFKSISGDPSKLKLGEIDYIFCREVIEHTPDPAKLLKNIKRFMHKDTVLILTTPNQMSWEFPFRPWWWYRYLRVTARKKNLIFSLNKFLEKPWICCDPPRHLYAFNKNNIEKLLLKENFEIIKITTRYTHEMCYSGPDYHNWHLDGLKSVQRIISNIYSLTGFRLAKLFDNSRSHGIDVLVYAKLKKS